MECSIQEFHSGPQPHHTPPPLVEAEDWESRAIARARLKLPLCDARRAANEASATSDDIATRAR